MYLVSEVIKSFILLESLGFLKSLSPTLKLIYNG